MKIGKRIKNVDHFRSELLAMNHKYILDSLLFRIYCDLCEELMAQLNFNSRHKMLYDQSLYENR